jgi:hypothetical protein
MPDPGAPEITAFAVKMLVAPASVPPAATIRAPARRQPMVNLVNSFIGFSSVFFQQISVLFL